MMKKIFAMMTLVMMFIAISVGAQASTTKTTETYYRDGKKYVVTKETTITKSGDTTKEVVVTTTVVTYVDEEGYTVTETTKQTDETITKESSSKSKSTSKDTKTSTEKSSSSTTKKKAPKRYVDITKKKVGARYYNALHKIRRAGGFDGVFTGKKFYPSKKITKKQFLKILRNLYGKSAPQNKGSKAKATNRWAKQQLLKVAKNKGMSLNYKKYYSDKVTRLDAVALIVSFAEYDSALKF